MDRKVLLGIGIGLLICSLLLMAFPGYQVSKDKIETLARDMGMIYPDEAKAMFGSK